MNSPLTRMSLGTLEPMSVSPFCFDTNTPDWSREKTRQRRRRQEKYRSNITNLHILQPAGIFLHLASLLRQGGMKNFHGNKVGRGRCGLNTHQRRSNGGAASSRKNGFKANAPNPGSQNTTSTTSIGNQRLRQAPTHGPDTWNARCVFPDKG